jgi:general secretion pathway protein M
MKEWFYSLQPRERLMVSGCAVVVIIALIYLLIWAPFAERYAQLAANVRAGRETLVWMQQASQQVRQLRQSNPRITAVNDTRSLLSIVDSTAKQAGVRNPITRMEPEGNDGVKLSMENADFDATIRWLGVLKRSYNVEVVRASINPSDAPGKVDTQFSLQRP